MRQTWEIRPRFWVLCLCTILIFFLFLYIGQAQTLKAQREQTRALEAQYAQCAAQAEELKRKIAFTETNLYVERMAREKLGLLKPDEIRYVISE